MLKTAAPHPAIHSDGDHLSRGDVVDLRALKANIEKGKIRGAAVDVFPGEPKSSNARYDSGLLGLPNLILTPHIGG
ncbi:MAG: hypothetical protein KAJ17_10230, partial [Candidatus Krumholzibacteria bacterium]|nr:hypothetical protein [Candidatus Krumholzibacteria bacterium]